MPIFIYCYQFVDLIWLYCLLGISFLGYLLPKQFLDFIQLSPHVHSYKKLGVIFIRKFSQEGDLINNLIKKTDPQYRVIKQQSSITKYISQTYHFERFHFNLLLFFLFITCYALTKKQYQWAALITLTNIIFNVYPNLLQQYNRIRLRKLLDVKPAKD